MLNARMSLGPAVKLYDDEELLATFVDFQTFQRFVAQGYSSIEAFNTAHWNRRTMADLRKDRDENWFAEHGEGCN